MDTTRIDCDRCNGLGMVCENTEMNLERRRCSLGCGLHGCPAVECNACGGLGYIGCAKCGEPIDAERFGNYCRDARQALCEGCELGSTHGSATSGNDGLRAVEDPTEPGRVWGNEPTLPEIQVPFSLLAWETPSEAYHAPVAGRFDNENPTVEIQAIEVDQ